MNIEDIEFNQPVMLVDGKMGLVTKGSNDDLTVGVQVPNEDVKRRILSAIFDYLGGGVLIQGNDPEPNVIGINTTEPPPFDIYELKVFGHHHIEIVVSPEWEHEDEPAETYEMAQIRAREGINLIR